MKALRPTRWQHTDYGALHVGDRILTSSDTIAKVLSFVFPTNPDARPDAVEVVKVMRLR
jgi:hypothetical protein